MLLTIPALISQVKSQLNCVSAAHVASLSLGEQDLIVDVREPNEHTQKNIDNAINIPRGILEMQMLARYPNAELNIYIHCATGGRACLSAEQLQRIGYKNVHVITCSIDDVCSAFS